MMSLNQLVGFEDQYLAVPSPLLWMLGLQLLTLLLLSPGVHVADVLPQNHWLLQLESRECIEFSHSE
jgi:hypothetical protein